MKELAAALADAANYASTVQNQLATTTNVADVLCLTKLYTEKILGNDVTEQEITYQLDQKLYPSVIIVYFNKSYINTLIPKYFTKQETHETLWKLIASVLAD